MRAPAALVAIPLLLGAIAGLQVAAGHHHVAICAAGGAVLALVAGIAASADRNPVDCVAVIITGAFLAGMALGSDAAQRAYAPPLLQWYHSRDTAGPVTLEGRLREDAAAGPFGVSMLIDVERITVESRVVETPGQVVGGVRLTVAGRLAASRAAEWRAGRRLRLTTLLREPPFYLDPGVADARPGLARRGVILVGSVKSAALVDVIGVGSPLTEAAASCRAWTRAQVADLVGRWSRRSGAVATAILIGDRTGLPDEEERRLQRAGTYHVIAISGGNIAILTLLLVAATKLLRIPPRIGASAVIVFLWFYAQVAGPAPSVRRAVLAAVAYLIGRLLDHKAGPSNILAVATAVAIADAPVTAFDPGFVLSFGATLGILIIVPRVTNWLPGRCWRPLRAAVGLLAATIAAEVALAPVGAALFSRMTAAGLLLNFIAIPLMTCVQAGSMLALVAGLPNRTFGAAAGYVVHLAATGLIESARLVDVAPWLAPSVSRPAWLLIAIYYAATAVAIFVPRVRRHAIAVAVAAMLLAATGVAPDASVPPRRAGALRVAFLDVGQGDATLVQLPDGRAFLVDAGGLPSAPPADQPDEGSAFDVGERVVVPALRALRVTALDTFVLTHADPDHVGGAPAVFRNLRPRAIWEGVPVPPHPARGTLVTLAERGGAEWRAVQRGETVRIAGVDIRVLHPPRPDWERQRVRNDDSVVLEFRMGGVSIVLPGDIGVEGERAIQSHVSSGSFVVFKAPHHGSATSSSAALLNVLRPSVVVFSAGRANHFGHPAASVLMRYRALKASMFSTAEDGAVILDTDGSTVQVRGLTGRQVTFNAGRR